ncbi:DUF4347 domain-containing protein [Paraburkholderia sp. Ac-20336]|uniref:DUF4347 domain-containing protein n=1 Tax=Paraburkholderia sp. Ac-20336 TaxID=2703886 RepID=UPI00197DD5BD|nr:DUF4347 domain-containing protein [Paraburkholderia sp. Ac-20336]MBN3802720.1 DUF4347 domain-containing protein [Paraburkholderia sp. Ac-20336]
MKIVRQWLKRLSTDSEMPRPRVAASPLLLALEPRVVYDASVAAVAAKPHAETHAHEHAHRAEPTHNDPAAASSSGQGASQAESSASASGTSNAAQRDAGTNGTNGEGAGTDTSTGSKDTSTTTHTLKDTSVTTPDASHQVVFIDPSVENYQILIAGLPAGTQYVVLDANSDGFAQIAQYLQTHHGIESIHLISHGTDGAIQAGSTWLTGADFSAYSAELAQIGAAMKPGGDFLIYGCDVAQKADGQALVQQIAALTHLNVAASTDDTGASALGGNWTLEYQAGHVHTAVIESASAQAQFNELLGVTVETFDTAAEANNDTGQDLGYRTSYTLDGVVYTTDGSVEEGVWNNGNAPTGPSDVNSGAPNDGFLEVNVNNDPMTEFTISLANGHTFTLSDLDISSVNGNFYIEANGNAATRVQIATEAAGGFVGSIKSLIANDPDFQNTRSVTLIDVNDPYGPLSLYIDNVTYTDTGPAVTTSSGNASWASANNGVGGAPVAVDSGLQLSDGGSSTAQSATVTIANVQAGDVLGFVSVNGISGSYSSGTGTLTLTASGTPTLAQWQAALESVTFANTLVTPSTVTRTVDFSFNDGTSTSNVASRSVNVTATDQSPIVVDGGSSMSSYQAGSTPTAISTFSVSDADNTTLASATISIASGYHSGDTLSFDNTDSTQFGNIGITANANGTLTLTSVGASATLVQWQHALDAVTFSTSAAAVSGARNFTISVNDGVASSSLALHTVNVTSGPTITTDPGSAAFVAGDNTASMPVLIDSGLSVADGQSTTLESATVQITGNFTADQDSLLFVANPATMGDIVGAYNSSTGTLTLTASGGATLAQWQAALSSVQYANYLTTPASAMRTISYQVNDGTTMSAVATRTVTVTDTDQTPIITTSGTTANFVAGDNVASTPVVIDSGIAVSDLDNTTLASATVQIGTGFHAGEDVLSFVNDGTTMGNITATYDVVHGTLMLNSVGASATLTQWQAALSAVTYTDTAITPDTTTRTISFTVNDGTKSSAAATAQIDVSDTDQTPIVTGTSGDASWVQGDNTAASPVTVDGGITVSDRDNTTLVSASVTIGNYDSNGDALLFTNDGATMGNITGVYASGVLTLTSSGGIATLAQWQAALRSVQFTDTAAAPSGAARTISFVVNDGVKSSSVWTRTVDVTLTDQTPVLTLSNGTTSFVAGDNVASTPVVVDPGITLSDSGGATIRTAEVIFNSTFYVGEDVLAFTGGAAFGDITATYTGAAGALELSSAGRATLAQWQAALRSITYTDTAIVPSGIVRTISFTVSDGIKTSMPVIKVVLVSATDQTPVVTASTSSVTYPAGGAPLTIDSGVTFSDRDSTVTPSLPMTFTLQIASGFQSGDTIMLNYNAATMGAGFSDSFNAATGTYTLNSNGMTVAQYQAILEGLQFSTASSAPLGARTLQLTANDGTKTSAPVAYTIDVTSSAPSLTTTSTGSATFVAGDNTVSTPVTVDGNLVVADPLGDVITSATVEITGNLHAGEDVLLFTSQNGIYGNYNALTGVLTLTGSGATNQQWQDALRSITYTDTAVTPNPAMRTISFVLDAGSQFSTALSRTVTVTDTDQTPLLSTSSTGSTSFVAGDNVASTPVVVDGGIAVSDLDNTTLASATVQIGAGFHIGEDVLSFTNDGTTMGNITASYDAVHGTLTLTSASANATLAQWQAALRSVTYTDTAITPDTTTRTIGFAVNDGTKTSAALSRTVTVADTDQTPLLSTSSTGSASFVAGDNVASTPVVIDSGIVVSDLDNATLASATVQIGSGFHAGEDVLSFTNDGATMGNITASYNAATGVLTLTSASANATLAQWQAALRSVTYTDTAITPDNTTRTIGFTVNDGIETSVALSRDVTVTDVDQTPLIATTSTGSAAFVSGDNTVSIPVVVDGGIVLSDLDNTTLASATVQVGSGFHAGEDVLAFTNDGVTMGNIVASYDAATGVLTLTSFNASATLAQWQAALRSVTYTDTAITPNNTTRTISFTVNDGIETSTALSRDVTVTDTDQTPVLSTSSTGSAAFVAGDNVASTPVVVDGGIAVSDLDNTTLASATVAIGSGFHAGEDVLSFTNDGATMGNIAASYDAATGVLTLTSSSANATLAQWQAALRSITYTDTAITPNTAMRTISFAVNDGIETSVALSRTVTVADTDQTPLVSTTSTGSAAFVSGDNTVSTPVVVDGGIAVGDRDNTTLASATVQIGTGFHAGEDVLAFTNDGATMGNIAASYNAATGVLTLTSTGASATLAQWQMALRSITYTDTAITPNTATRTISFTVNDGTKASIALARAVGVTATHQTLIVDGGGVTLSYTANGNAADALAVGDGITLTDRNPTPPTSATVSFSGTFDPQHDVLAFTSGGTATGDISAAYDAASGVLRLTSASGTATLAQWQAALAAVSYRDTRFESTGSSRTIAFAISDGVASSAPATRTVQVVATTQPSGTPILPEHKDEPLATPTIVAPPVFNPSRTNPLIVSGTTGYSDGVSNPLIVLEALKPPAELGTIVLPPTRTFTQDDQHNSSLGDTHVSPLDSIAPPDLGDETASLQVLASLDVHPQRHADGSFALLTAALLPNSPDTRATSIANDVSITLADGEPLPSWLHYDAARGELSGVPPAGVHEVRVTLAVRDAFGRVTHREVVVSLDAAHRQAPHAPAPKPVKSAPPHAALPPAKPSLSAQFASAHAALHVTRAGVAGAKVAHAEAVDNRATHSLEPRA